MSMLLPVCIYLYLSHSQHWSFSLFVFKFSDGLAAQLIYLYCFQYIQFFLNPSQLQLITSLARVSLVPVVSPLTGRLLCAYG